MFALIRRRDVRWLAAASLLLTPSLAWAHAVVYPKKSAAGAFEKYVLRVPNERDIATTRVEIHFPSGVRVEAFADVPGWQLQVLTDSAKAVTGAIWTGTLERQRFVEFPFEAANPKAAARLEWATYQTYANGERVEWTGPEHTKTPASVTVIGAPSLVGDLGLSGWVSVVAVLVALISLGFVARRPSTAHFTSVAAASR